jgi:predicted RNase H-like HicB family nuclease
MNFAIDTEREAEGRWLAEVIELPGVLVYGQAHDEAIARVKALGPRVLADRIEHGEDLPDITSVASAGP